MIPNKKPPFWVVLKTWIYLAITKPIYARVHWLVIKPVIAWVNWWKYGLHDVFANADKRALYDVSNIANFYYLVSDEGAVFVKDLRASAQMMMQFYIYHPQKGVLTVYPKIHDQLRELCKRKHGHVIWYEVDGWDPIGTPMDCGFWGYVYQQNHKSYRKIIHAALEDWQSRGNKTLYDLWAEQFKDA
jgi:hypothetical protein